MPHKRAKRSVREELTSQRKSDLPPSQSVFTPSDIPKSMARVLNAEATQNAFRARRKGDADVTGNTSVRREAKGDMSVKAGKKRKRENENESKKELKIQPGESLAHFRRRVDDDLRSTVTNAMKNSSSSSKLKLKESLKIPVSAKKKKPGLRRPEDSDSDVDNRSKKATGRRDSSPDFIRLSSSTPKRLNDVVMAPPELKGVPRLSRLVAHSKMRESGKSAGKTSNEDSHGDGGILTAQQKRMMELEREKAINRYRALKEARLKEAVKGSALSKS